MHNLFKLTTHVSLQACTCSMVFSKFYGPEQPQIWLLISKQAANHFVLYKPLYSRNLTLLGVATYNIMCLPEMRTRQQFSTAITCHAHISPPPLPVCCQLFGNSQYQYISGHVHIFDLQIMFSFVLDVSHHVEFVLLAIISHKFFFVAFQESSYVLNYEATPYPVSNL